MDASQRCIYWLTMANQYNLLQIIYPQCYVQLHSCTDWSIEYRQNNLQPGSDVIQRVPWEFVYLHQLVTQ